MRDWAFDRFARRTAAILDRRSALGLLGGAAAATALTWTNAGAKKKKKKKCKGNNNICRADTVDFCADAPSAEEEEACKVALFKCCSNTALKCKSVGQFLTCCHNAGFPC